MNRLAVAVLALVGAAIPFALALTPLPEKPHAPAPEHVIYVMTERAMAQPIPIIVRCADPFVPNPHHQRYCVQNG